MNEDRLFVTRSEFEHLPGALREHGYRCVAPQVRDGAIVYEHPAAVLDLPRGISDAQAANLEHSRWDEVATRCLACSNSRVWDSCFTSGHAWLAGHAMRPDTRTRYRQWLVHKLATWHDQYGRSGCVGCGRCVTWCPVGIDITEEARALCSP